ncbi:actinia tenebrosa protease inhibitors-like [Ornithodoros turicata]|uniref:actinia tenebrosa protease inhibitors-like n=1 Tax=Ornithodoros turicata TaxID=34597 RepID=UPI003138AA42
MGYFPRFYYDREAQSCKTFIYGGCQGNENNFAKEEECLGACGGISVQHEIQQRSSIVDAPISDNQELPRICYQPKDPGHCEAYFERYYYDSVEGICKKFIYGGCQGNSNNFKTIEQCNITCGGDSRHLTSLYSKETEASGHGKHSLGSEFTKREKEARTHLISFDRMSR